MTKKELQRQIDDLRERVGMLENNAYYWAGTQPQTWTNVAPVPVNQIGSTGDPVPFPCPTTTHI